MEPSQTNNHKSETQDIHQERIRKIDSEINSKKNQFIEELEDSQEETSRRRRHPKFPGSQIETLELPTKKKENLKLAPSLANTLQITGKDGFGGKIFYNEKHNLIVVQPFYMPLSFYDATTLLPLEGWETPQLDVVGLSFCSETDTFLFVCLGSADLYSYDFSQKTLKKVQKLVRPALTAVTFIDATSYILSSYSGKLCFGNLQDGSLTDVVFGKVVTWSLQRFENRNVLFSTLEKGKMIIYRTDRLPRRLPAICSVQAHSNEVTGFTNMEKAVIHGKELIITRSQDRKMKVWHFVKGRMRLLRVIQLGEDVGDSCIYLESYKMICTTKGKESIKFFSLISGQLKNTLELKRSQSVSVVFMKDKNAIGVADWSRKVLEIIQLHPRQE